MARLYHDPILSLWLAWCFYWLVASLRTKPTRRQEGVASRASHIVPLLLGVLLLSFPRLAGPWLRVRVLPPAYAWFWVGFCCVALGLGFSVVARVWLGGNWSGTVTLKQGHELIRTGPYRFVRHPIYTGLLLAVLGSAIAIGEWRGLLGFALFVLAFVHKLGIEERFLTQQFGDSYTRYRRDVPALVPGFHW